jgi:hypothetical protein
VTVEGSYVSLSESGDISALAGIYEPTRTRMKVERKKVQSRQLTEFKVQRISEVSSKQVCDFRANKFVRSRPVYFWSFVGDQVNQMNNEGDDLTPVLVGHIQRHL